MLDKFIHLKDTLAKLAKIKQDARSSRDTGAGMEVILYSNIPVDVIVGSPTKFGMSMCAIDLGNSKAWPPNVRVEPSASSYGKAPAISHQRGMPFRGLQI